jgi:hypothetical protein
MSEDSVSLSYDIFCHSGNVQRKDELCEAVV